MNTKPETLSRNIARAFAMGVLLSMFCFYGIHVMGTWELENYRPNEDTTYNLLLHNTCAILGETHTLRPNTGIPTLEDGINGTKLSGSFMNFTDGHIVGMIILAIVFGFIVFVLRARIRKNIQSKPVM